MEQLASSAEAREFKLEKSVPGMIDKAIAAALTRIQTDVNALNVIVTTSEH